MEVVALALELGRGVDLVGHDPGDCLLNILHPFDHFRLTHNVDILDERIILLPKSHLGVLVIPLLEEKGSEVKISNYNVLSMLSSLERQCVSL